MSASTVSYKNRAKTNSTSGWMAFDLKQRSKNQGRDVSNIHSESYPMLSGPTHHPSSLLHNNHGVLLEKPFSSVVVASMNYQSSMDTGRENFTRPRIPLANSSLQNADAAVTTETYQKLMYLHPWADESLIQDVLACFNNNINEVLSSLEAMRISEIKDTKNTEVVSNYVCDNTPFEEVHASKDPSSHTYINSVDDSSSRLLYDASKSLPVEPEPEWEEDDVYLIHRKDAIRMIRSASRHSKAANDAYARGDRLSAHRFSLKAQEERAAAQKLNAEAASAILTARNSENDPWTLDLHGLHAAEAVHALGERLQIVESLMSSNCSATANGVQKESNMLLPASAQTMTHVEIEKSARQHQSFRLRPTLLQVITGKGNHSRGAAALPSAIRNFLSENRYHFDESRPGVITIRPKFRKQ